MTRAIVFLRRKAGAVVVRSHFGGADLGAEARP
jgi:hypothetical protein